MRKLIDFLVTVKRRWLETALVLAFATLLIWVGTIGYGFVPKPPATPTPQPGVFDGQAAYGHAAAQMAFGARPVGSQANRKTADYIARTLKRYGWEVELQDYTYKGVNGRNVIGKAGKGPLVIVGAHYDTRRLADNDPDTTQRNQPVPGANDGASGVAVLLELARALNRESLRNEIWLAFFDAEDNGRLDGWDFSVGSQTMAQNLTVTPQAVIVVDMVGDTDQKIYKERNSTATLQDALFQEATKLGYKDQFVSEFKYSMIDDHTPFLQRGFAAVDIIDFDYPYWHTTQDTLDKISPASLERVGRVLMSYLQTTRP